MALTLKIQDLSRAVNNAAARVRMQLETEIHCGPIIMGIILRKPVNDIEAVQKIANSITDHVGTSQAGTGAGNKLEPAVLIKPGGPIICGFIAENVTLRE